MATLTNSLSRPQPSLSMACLRLVRPANLVTAAADIVAGWLIAGGSVRSLSWLIAASVCLYAGGVVLNDFFDRKIDAIERPERTLPSGTLPAWIACAGGFVLLIAGVVFGLMASPLSAIFAFLISLHVLLYDTVAKPTVAGPIVMGACRALNLLLGLSAVPDGLRTHWFLALISFTYIVAITLLSRGEVHGSTVVRARAIFIAMCLVTLSLLALPAAIAGRWISALPFVAFLAVSILPPFWKASVTPHPNTIRRAVHAGIVSLITLDACLIAGYAGLVPAAALLSLSVVATELAKFFAVT